MDIDYILDNTEKYKAMIEKRYMSPEIIDNIVDLHKQYVNSLFRLSELNRLSNTITKAMKTTKPNDFIEASAVELELDDLLDYLKIDLTTYGKAQLINLGKLVKSQTSVQKKVVDELFNKRNDLVYKVPNLLHDSVYVSKDEASNIILFNNKKDRSTEFKMLGQYELCMKLGIIEDGSDIAGNRGYFLVNEGVRLNYALLNYALDFLESKDYKLMYTPHFVTKDKMKNICQLSEFNDTLYEVKDQDLFLIATSEQPLTAYFTDKRLKDLPEKLCGISTCYRKETGSHGKDTNGIFRVHQFEKVEQFCVTESDHSWEMMETMINISKEFYDTLGIEYRVVNIVSGELNNAASMKYDLEGWFRGSEKFRELVSCSNTTDYFSRRIHLKNTKNEYLHMLNSTLCANTRTLCCILENNQCDDGVIVPDVLRKYYNKEKILFKN